MESITQVAQETQMILTTDADRIAEETGFVRRRSKLGGAEFAQTLVLGWLNKPQASLGELTQTAAVGGVSITPQGLDQRFTSQAADFLEHLLADAVERLVVSQPVCMPILQRFSAVEIQDSSVIPLPEELAQVWQGCGNRAGRGNAALKVEVRWDLVSGSLTGPLLENGRVNEHVSQIQAQSLPAGALRLADLGYWGLKDMQTQAQAGVFWLSYFYPSTVVFDFQGHRLDMVKFLSHSTVSRFECQVFLGQAYRLPVRLLVVRVPQEVADQRRRRLHERAQRLQKPVSQRSLDLAEWTLLVTNIPAEKLTLREALVLIRIRWQIELLFKLWKSHGLIDEWRSGKPWRILCEIYAKLLAMLIQHWLFVISAWSTVDRSLIKAAQTIQRFALILLSCLSEIQKLEETMKVIQRCLSFGCRLNKSRKSPRLFQLLLALEESETLV